ncbi:hypothetical protein GGR50DRAFT_643022 [Xylaria sp. CBS 124048]|nr:hypothetical protein GGR50DRAFT_643022 [Xylaria sp. CBS 124048]
MASSTAFISRRSNGPSPGVIAGAVVGSVLGGTFLVIVLGFLYFRYRRKCRIAHAEEALSIPKAPETYQSGPPPSWQGFPPLQTIEPPNGRAPGVEHQSPRGAFPLQKPSFSSHIAPSSPYGEEWINNIPVHPLHDVDYDSLPHDIDFTIPARQQTFPIVSEHAATASLNHASTAPEAANLSYYDMRVSMDSDPVGPNTPPSRQMDEMYKAQLKEAEEHRRNNSLPKRIWDAVTRRQSSRKTNGTNHSHDNPPPPQQPFGQSSVVYSVPIKQEPDPGSSNENVWQGLPIATHYVAEPEQILEDGPSADSFSAGARRESDFQSSRVNHKTYRGQTDDSQYGGFPNRIDSTIQGKVERDPALPSSALTRDSTYGLPLGAQPPSPTEQRERLQSPDIPEPMDLDGLQLEENNSPSPFRPSHSPQLSSDFTINPMAILHPTNPTEQAAYTTYQIKHSVSPPPMPTAAPEINNTEKPTQEDTVGSPPPKEEDFADMYLDLPPSDDEKHQSSDSYEYPTTPEHSSAAESSGRTPDTRPTVSPLPFPTIPEYTHNHHTHHIHRIHHHHHTYNNKPEEKSDPSDILLSPSSSSSKPSPSQQGGVGGGGSQQLLVCPECGRAFDQIHKLNHHKRYHDRTHECTYAGCDRKFGTKTHLDRHINDRHLKLKTYHCTEPTCAWFKGGKSFPRKDNWRRHMMKKHGTTPQDFDNMDPS